MSGTSTIIEEAQLLKQNRADLVAALNEVGFTEVDETTPLSEIANYMKWAGGLLDLRLACIAKSTQVQQFFTRDEWEGLSASTKSSYVKLGICIRAERQQFIISKDNVLSSTGNTIMTWAPNNSNNVRGLTDFYGNPLMQEDIDGEANTDLILAAVETNGISYPAAQRARAYKASTFADGGYDDPTVWSLPAIGQLRLLQKYCLELNAEFSHYGMQSLDLSQWYWSSTECSSASAWGVYMYSGSILNNTKNYPYRVRAVAPVLVPAVPAI